MKLLRNIFAILLLAGLCSSCVKENFEPNISSEDGCQTINFSYRNYTDVVINTRSTLPSLAEKRLLSLMVFVFKADGSLVYKRYFDNDSRVDSKAKINGPEALWYAEELDPALGQYTNGTIRIKSNNVDNGHLYIIANIDDPISSVSRETLSYIENENQLINTLILCVTPSIQRSGNFIMTAKSSVSIAGSTITLGAAAGSGAEDIDYIGSQRDAATKVLMLKGVDVKVEFNVGIVPGALTIREETIGGATVTVTQEIESFTPLSWQVINVPKGCYMLERSYDAPDEDKGYYFDSPVYSFEKKIANNYLGDPTKPRTLHNFSFYMIENRQSANLHASVGSEYHLRDKRTKNPDGTYSTSGEKWVYAPENSTYVIFTGDVTMKYYEDVSAQQTLHTEATYCVHLGDMAESLDNYDLCRNTHYVYNINIHGVDKIQVEVEKDNSITGYQEINEEESGAMGNVYVSQEPIYVFDAHYGQRVYRFNAPGIIKQCNGDFSKLTWFVSTPFGRSGMPDKVGLGGGVDVPNGLDYKWIHFMLNSKEQDYYEYKANPDTGGAISIHNDQYPNYCHKNRVWPEGGIGNPAVMDVIALCALLREETQKWQIDPATSIFDSQGNIYVTAFVDEFYYDVDPISEARRASLWKEFVNKNDRVLHIMCNSSSSADGASTLIKSAVTIKQKSIQTIYNVNNSTEGWGSESISEVDESVAWYFRKDETRSVGSGSLVYESGVNNKDTHNGLYNTGHIWGLLTGGSSSDGGTAIATKVTNKLWSEHLNFAKENDSPYDFLREENNESATLRYTCLARNRDENGNGLIEPDEIKWYIASLVQLQHLFIGDAGLSTAAKFYNLEDRPNEKTTFEGNAYWKWRSHVVSSTAEGNKAVIVWAEEGVSTSYYAQDNGWNKPGVNSVRCVRNLDAYSLYPKNIADPTSYPQSVVDMQSLGDGVYQFDFSRLNDLSKRLSVSSELLPMDEKSSMANLSNSFVTGPLGEEGQNINSGTVGDDYYASNYFWRTVLLPDLKKNVSHCPHGYRMPNIREMAVAFMYIKDLAFWNNANDFYAVSNYYSFGNSIIGGNDYDTSGNKAYTWYVSKSKIAIEPGTKSTTVKIRCVKDI